jgi:hypothetical protein
MQAKTHGVRLIPRSHHLPVFSFKLKNSTEKIKKKKKEKKKQH